VIDVLILDGAKIAASTGFMAADLFTDTPSAEAGARGSWITGAQLFARFGLPPALP
jgi:hypothetical protein